MEEHPYGWLSLLPPVAAIALAIITRRVIVSLLAGVLLGALITTGGNPLAAVATACDIHLWQTLLEPDNLTVFAFTALMGAMVGIINKCGGMRGLVAAISPLARSRRGGQLVVWGLGLLVFFDDYANTVLLGNTLRPLCDRLRISREKLAYLVDSTAAPVSGLALISTWVAAEITFVDGGIKKIPGANYTALDLFLWSIPYRFYVLWSLAFVPIVAILRRDFGPMVQAERRAIALGEDAGGQPQAVTPPAMAGEDDETAPGKGVPARWFNAAIPVAVTVAVILAFLLATGRAALAADANPSLMEIFGEADSYASLLWGALAGVLSAGALVAVQRLLTVDETVAAAGAGARLVVPALAILWLASSLSAMTGNDAAAADAQREEIARQRADAALEAANGDPAVELSAVDSLVAAGLPTAEIAALLDDQNIDAARIASLLWTAGRPAAEIEAAVAQLEIAEPERREAEIFLATAAPPEQVRPESSYRFRDYRLYTGNYLSSLLGDRIPAPLLPTLIFVLSCAVAFATGTSWGTMGIVMPLAIPLVHGTLSKAGGEVLAGDPILLCSVGSVLAGAIFGDHCSPISDTTVLSSQSSGCNHIAHVWTQLPYALLVGGLSVVLGTLPVGFGVPWWLLLPLGVIAMAAVLRLFGKKTGERGSD